MQLSELAKSLIDHYQRGFPLEERPFARMAKEMNTSETAVLEAVKELECAGVLSRLGPVFNHCKAGASCLVAVAVPQEKVENIASIISTFEEVNHNYEREHRFNIWFVVTASNANALDDALDRIEVACGYPLMVLPMERSFHIDLGFKVHWQGEDGYAQ